VAVEVAVEAEGRGPDDGPTGGKGVVAVVRVPNPISKPALRLTVS